MKERKKEREENQHKKQKRRIRTHFWVSWVVKQQRSIREFEQCEDNNWWGDEHTRNTNRSNNHKWQMYHWVQQILGDCTMTEVELWGILDGLKLILDKRFERILIQTNSLETIIAIREGAFRISNTTLLRRIHQIPTKVKQWNIQHIHQEENIVADSLVNMICDKKPSLRLFEDPPLRVQFSLSCILYFSQKKKTLYYMNRISTTSFFIYKIVQLIIRIIIIKTLFQYFIQFYSNNKSILKLAQF